MFEASSALALAIKFDHMQLRQSSGIIFNQGEELIQPRLSPWVMVPGSTMTRIPTSTKRRDISASSHLPHAIK